MSHRYRNAVWELRGTMPPLELVVLMEIADRTNGTEPVERGAWPSLPTLAKAAGVSRATAQRAVHSLARRGLIEIEIRSRSKDGGLPSVYRLAPHLNLTSPPSQDVTAPIANCDDPHLNLTSEPRNGTKEWNHHPPLTPQGGKRGRGKTSPEGDPLFKEWNQVAEVGKRNECLETARIFETTKEKLRAVRRVAGHLEARGASWAELMAGFEAYEQEARLTPKNCSVEKLAANESVVELLLKAGANGVRKHVPIEEDPAYAPRG